MTTINTNTPNYGTNSNGGGSSGALGQADFLRLMTAQMQYQDPTKPMDSAQMLSQLAQFSQVQGIDSLNTSMQSMAAIMESDQTLRAANLAGRELTVETDTIEYTSGSVKGEVVAERGGTVQIDIVDATGKRVARRTVEADGAGAVAFEWDGKDDAGNVIAAGKYTIKATGQGGDAAPELSVRLTGRVESVSIENYMLTLNMPGLGEFGLGAVRNIAS